MTEADAKRCLTHHACDCIQWELDSLRAERDRMKGALEWISDNVGHKPPCGSKDDCYAGCEAQMRARQALAKEGKNAKSDTEL